jgi:predicted dehydrogenase
LLFGRLRPNQLIQARNIQRDGLLPVMTDEGIRVGVIGAGVFGSHHARHYAANPAARLVAVVDADPARAGAAAEKYGAAPLGHHRDLVGKVDAVSVCVPGSLHEEVAADLMEAGIHLFVEKPLANTAAGAAALAKRAEKAGIVLQVGHIERFSPAFRELASRAGRVRAIEAIRHSPWNGRSTDVDVVLDLMIHDIDLVLALVRQPVVSVEARGTVVRTAFNDSVDAMLRFGDGTMAKLSASRLAETPKRTLRVTEEGGEYLADLGGPSLTFTASGRTEQIPVAPADNLGAEIAAFLGSVAGGPPPLVDGRAGREAVVVAEMIIAAVPRGAEAQALPMETD